MKLFPLTITVLTISILLAISCKKERSKRDPLYDNLPPSASAGVDQVIFLPINSITLDGNLSLDANNNIVAYQWVKISGPSSFNISNASAIKTQVTSLTEGVYQFELKVTDTGALFSFDTIRIIVRTCGTNRPMVSANLTPIGLLPNPRSGLAVASAANKIVFAGGFSFNEPGGSSKVDIYDMTTKTWATANLSRPRSDMTAIAAGNRILFAGGYSGEGGNFEEYHSTVDIYDAAAHTWSVTSMSNSLSQMTAATIGSKVLFAGGHAHNFHEWSNTVAIYDISTGTWTNSYLSERKANISTVTLNNKVYFAGGWLPGSSRCSDKIDIYDNVSDTWSTATLSAPRSIGGGGIAIDNKIFWAGGADDLGETCMVEIKDVLSQATEFDNLSAGGYVKAFSVKDKIVYCGGYDNELDVYDVNAKTWSILVIPNFVTPLLAVNNTIYVKDSDDTSQMIWKLEF